MAARGPTAPHEREPVGGSLGLGLDEFNQIAFGIPDIGERIPGRCALAGAETGSAPATTALAMASFRSATASAQWK